MQAIREVRAIPKMASMWSNPIQPRVNKLKPPSWILVYIFSFELCYDSTKVYEAQTSLLVDFVHFNSVFYKCNMHHAILHCKVVTKFSVFSIVLKVFSFGFSFVFYFYWIQNFLSLIHSQCHHYSHNLTNSNYLFQQEPFCCGWAFCHTWFQCSFIIFWSFCIFPSFIFFM
jgi:hypothetical protein